jgi:hypothetical protein
MTEFKYTITEVIDIVEVNEKIDDKVKLLNSEGYEVTRYIKAGNNFKAPRTCWSCGRKMYIIEGDIIIYTTNGQGRRKFRCLECAKRLNIV